MTTNLSNDDWDRIVLDNDARGGERMINAVVGFLARFVCYPNAHTKTAHALWCVHAHLMSRWESTPRLAFLSVEPGSGKTRALEITELLVPNPIRTVSVTPAYIFRKVGAETGAATILYDEIDTVFGPKAKDNEEIRGLLNAGYRRGATAGRCVIRGKTVETEELPAYAAVALAGLGWLPDTILTRSIIVRMRRRHAGEKVEPFRVRLHEKEGHAVRMMIESWARFAVDRIDFPELMPPEIQDRDADNWEALIAVADAIGGDWPTRAREAAVALVADSKEVEPSLGIKLLIDLRTVFEGAAETELPSKQIIQMLCAIDESPWGDLRGKAIDERGLAHRLRQYGIKSKTIRCGNATPKGYSKSEFLEAWQRYLPLRPTCATSATPQHGLASKEPVADVADVADVQTHGAALCDYCLEPELPGKPLMEVHMGGPAKMLHQTCISKAEDGEILPFLDRRNSAGLRKGRAPEHLKDVDCRSVSQ